MFQPIPGHISSAGVTGKCTYPTASPLPGISDVWHCGYILVEMNHTDTINIIDRALMEDQGEPTLTVVTAKGPYQSPGLRLPWYARVCMCMYSCMCGVLGEQWVFRIMCKCVWVSIQRREKMVSPGLVGLLTPGVFVLSLLQCSAQRVRSQSLCWTPDWSPVPQKRLVREKD